MASYKGLAIFLSPAIFMAAYSACKSSSPTTPHALKSRSVLYFAPHIVSSLQWIKDHVHDLASSASLLYKTRSVKGPSLASTPAFVLFPSC